MIGTYKYRYFFYLAINIPLFHFTGSYTYPEYSIPVLPTYEQDEYQQNGAYQELFYNETFTEPEIPNYQYQQNQRPFSASSSSCSSAEGSEANQYNYTNLISFYGQNQNGRQENFGGNFNKMATSPVVQEGGYTSVIVDNTQFHHHGGGVNEFVH